MMHTVPRVLIVDDEPDICSVLAIALEAEGFEVDSATDARLALDRLSRTRPTW